MKKEYKNLKVVMMSNWLSPHQYEIAKTFHDYLGDNFKFISCFGPTKFKKQIANYEDETFVIKFYRDNSKKEEIIRLVNDADICLVGSFDRELLIHRNKPSFFMAEHVFKDRHYKINPINLLRLIHLHKIYNFLDDTNSFLLCNSAFSKKQFNLARLFKDRTLKFGYFPRGLVGEDVDKRFPKNKNDVLTLLWSGRFVGWKHPEYIFYAAKILNEKRVNYAIRFVCPKNEQRDAFLLRHAKEIASYNIEILDFLPNNDLLDLMSKSHIYLFTSDNGEGFGAVLYEAMSAKCCCIGNVRAGAANLLLKNGENGFVYKTKRQFKKQIYKILNNYQQIEDNAVEAKKFIDEKYNYRVAVKNILDFYLSGYQSNYVDEPMSKI